MEAMTYTRTAADPTKYLYNAGAELNDLTGYYETFYRNYDATIGRFTGVDIMAAKYSSLTPYQYAFNDPVTFNDPLGDDPVHGIPQPSWDHKIDFGGAMSFGEFSIMGLFSSGTPWSINSGSLFRGGTLRRGQMDLLNSAALGLNDFDRAQFARGYATAVDDINAYYNDVINPIQEAVREFIRQEEFLANRANYLASRNKFNASREGPIYFAGPGIIAKGLDQTLLSVRNAIASAAENMIGSTAYNYSVSIDNFDTGTNKCNKFCYDALVNAGADPGLPNGNPIKRLFGAGSPPTAGQWADPNYSISGWRVLGVNEAPQRGDIVAYSYQYSDATGHVAIITGYGTSVGTSGTYGMVYQTGFGWSMIHTISQRVLLMFIVDL